MIEKKLKISHLSVMRNLTSGQRKQLLYEYKASKKLSGVEWTTLVCHTGYPKEPFEQRIPILFRAIILRGLYGWLIALKLSRSHDYLLMRHMTFDPFSFIFSSFIKNRLSVHHAKEIEELKLISPGIKGKIASFLENIFGRFAVKNTVAILGVTREISEYERDLHAPTKLVGVYTNGIDSNEVNTLLDDRVDGEIHAAFICGDFSAWHGLDKLIKAVDHCDVSLLKRTFFIHLIGRVGSKDLVAINFSEKTRDVFIVHGSLDADQYEPILSMCDFGFASLAMERNNLKEAATLKVREMLLLGLPVVSGHKDTALDNDFPYYKILDTIQFDKLSYILDQWQGLSRIQVREESQKFLEKSVMMINTASFIKSTC